MLEKSGFVEKLEGEGRIWAGKHLDQLIAHTLLAHGLDTGGQFLHGGECLGLHLKPKHTGETNRAKHAKLIFGKAFLGIPDSADEFPF